MDLPIDARNAPFRDKYLDEETQLLSRWFIFGEDPIDRTLDLSDPFGDVFVGLTRDQADDLMTARKLFVESVLKIINKR